MPASVRTGLTLVISTRRAGPELAAYLRHLRRTSGVARLQILVCVNPGREGLGAVYQRLLQQAHYPVVCCLHDDLRFARHSRWGRQVLQAFARHPEFAILGAAGSLALDADGLPREMLGQVTHRVGGQSQFNAYSERFASPVPALVLDGLLLALQRQRLSATFDTALTGFHYYDVALTFRQSLAALQHQAGGCGVLTQLGITHLSGGNYGRAFETARRAFVSRYRPWLPRRLLPDLMIKRFPAFSSPLPNWALCLRVQETQGLSALLAALGPVSALRILNVSGQPLAVETFPEWAQTPEICVGLRGSSWEANQASVNAFVASASAPLVLLLDSRVQPLNTWLPLMIQDFQRWPKLASLGVRLHDPESHLLCHNGMMPFWHPDGRADIALRGLNTPYTYRNQLEWDSLGGWAHALMVRREPFVACGGLQGPDWVPGLGLNVRLRQAHWRTAVDSRLVGYWLGPDDSGGEWEYRQFLAAFQDWLSSVRPAGRPSGAYLT